MTIDALIRDASDRLKDVTDTPRLDAEILLAHALHESRAKLLADLRDTAPSSSDFETALARRAQGEPLAYILGEWEFFSHSFVVEPPALVPRPETEHLVEIVVAEVGEKPVRVLDAGTGTGCVAVSIALACKNATVLAVDIQPANVQLASRNASRHEVDARVATRQSDLFGAVGEGFDVICSNPPYIAETDWPSLSRTIRDYEDPVALTSGRDGLDCIGRLIAESGGYLEPGGLLAFEFGVGQRDAIAGLMNDAGFCDIHFAQDLAQRDRVACGRMPA